MKKIGFIMVFLLLISCKNNTKENVDKTQDTEVKDINTNRYPENFKKILEQHGGLAQWKKMKTLSFTIKKENGNEVITNNLQTRQELINTPDHLMGYDGKDLWLLPKNDSYQKPNRSPRFYKGLMFYFYAMPFVLADEGIKYSDTEPLNFEGHTYQGILISYEDGVGDSPDDEYIIYYNPETFQMEWSAYTVTFGDDQKSDDFHFIKYDEWQKIKGLKLPNRISWYNYKNNQPTEFRNIVEFTEVELSQSAPDDKIFQKPNNAKIIK